MKKENIVNEVVENAVVSLHDDCDMGDFTTHVATLFGEDQVENIVGVILGVQYKDGMIKTLTYIAEDQNAKDIFDNIYSNIATGLKKLIEVAK